MCVRWEYIGQSKAGSMGANRLRVPNVACPRGFPYFPRLGGTSHLTQHDASQSERRHMWKARAWLGAAIVIWGERGRRRKGRAQF